MNPAAVQNFNRRKAALNASLYRTLVRIADAEVFIPFATGAVRQEMDTYGYRTVNTGVAHLPDSYQLDVKPGDTFKQLDTEHQWRIDEIVKLPSEAARKLVVTRLES